MQSKNKRTRKMKHKKPICRSITAVLAMAVCSTPLVGCKNIGDSVNTMKNQHADNAEDSSPLHVSLDHSYASEEVSIEGMSNINDIVIFGDNLLISGSDTNYQDKTCIYHMADGTWEDAALAYPDSLDEKTECYPVASFVGQDGNLTFVYHAYLWDDTNEEAPYQEIGYTMETYDSDLHVLETKDVGDIIGDNVYFNRMITDADGNYYLSVSDETTGGSMLYIYDNNFQKTGEISDGFQYIDKIMPAGDEIVISYQDDEYNSCFGKIDKENNTVEKIEISGMPTWFNGGVAGDGNYDFYVFDSTAAYGVSLQDNTCTEAINWINSDFTGDSVSQVIPVQDGRFLVTTYDFSGAKVESSLHILTERDPDELKNMQIITLSSLYLSTDLSKTINRFNRSNTEYRIAVVDYSKYNSEEDWEAGINQFESDMAAGIVADIICTDSLHYESLANKGIFLDLDSYMDTLDKDAYFMNFFDALRYGDKLYRLGFSYSVETLEGKTEFTGDKSGISIQEFTEIIRNLPEGMTTFAEMTKNNALYQFCQGNLNAFVDIKNATCQFNCPEFVELLELCSTYPDETENMNSMGAWDETAWNDYWEEEQYQYINNKVLLRSVYINNIKSYLHDRYTYFDNAPVTELGYPTLQENSNGGRFNVDFSLAISAGSDKQEQAWKFFETALSEESQEELSWSIPVRKEAFDKRAQEALKPDTYVDENGQTQEVDYTVYRGNEEIKMPAPTQQDVDAVKAYITGVTELNYQDDQIYTIVQEESEKFFSGDQTAQQAADMIQSRASLYLSEQS